MNIFIAGGGRVGFHLARLLSAEKHDVTVIEKDRNQVEHVDYSLDVRTVLGRAEDVLLLKSLDAGSADLFIAATGVDEVNLITATTAKGLGAKQVVARVHDPLYNESDILYETVMGIDYILSPQALTAREIVNYVEHPGIVATESFGRGHIQMMQVRVAAVPLKEGETLRDLVLPKDVLLGVIGRNGDVEIPRGDSTLHVNDYVTLIGRKESMDETIKIFQGVEVRHDKVVIMGGSRTSLHLAEVLEKRGRSVKLLEWNMARCNELAAVLKKTKVVCRDATSRLSLEQEHVDGADIFIAATHDDERNIMASVLAKEVGVREALAVVHQPDFAPLVAKLGIDHAVTPRACIANRILKLVNRERSSALAVLEDGKIEILEFKLDASSPLVGEVLKAIKFPKQTLVASILRGEEVIVPRGADALQAGDSVIVIAHARSLEAIQKLFQQ
ncbi:MAG: Trk system potassium transporter TrkA [Candidatus Hydrogenedentes bacterium]|nr:Trk system potassium transporter TrkA [Candidatus Hydrogenedentota bacterium]